MAAAPQPTRPLPRVIDVIAAASARIPTTAATRARARARWQREPAGDEAEDDPEHADRLRGRQARHRTRGDGQHAHDAGSDCGAGGGDCSRLSFLRAFHAYRIRRSAPMNSTTSPWMMEREVARELRDLKISGSRLRCDVPVSKRTEEKRCKTRADRRVSTEQRDGDAEEADRWERIVLDRDRYSPAEHVHRTADAREGTRDRHREEVAPRDVDAAVAGCVGAESDGPHLVAEGRPVEHDRIDDECRDADEEADVRSLQDTEAPEGRELAGVRHVLRGRGGDGSWLSGPSEPRSHRPVQYMIQLSMIVMTTSCAPTVAFRKPAIPASSAPARPAARSRGRRAGTAPCPRTTIRPRPPRASPRCTDRCRRC